MSLDCAAAGAVVSRYTAAMAADSNRDVEELDAAETCNMLHTTETNQRGLFHRGRSKIRAALEDSTKS